MEHYKLNDRVKIVGRNIKGKIAFIGETHFKDGILYGIIMDEAKGRHNGTVDGICYFKCPKNQGTFERACQLERDDADYSDCNEMKSKVLHSGPKYPNYLRHRSKLNLEQSECRMKSKQCGLQRSNEQISFEQQPDYNGKCVESSEAKDDITLLCKVDDKEVSRRTSDKLHKTLEEMAILKTELNCRNRQLAGIQSNLSRLKSRLRWNRKCSYSSSLKDNNLKIFIGREIDSIVKNMEDNLNNVETKRFPDYSKGDDGLKEENNFLFQHILDLEKQTEILIETMLQIRSIILKQIKKRRCNQNYSFHNCAQQPAAKIDQTGNDSYGCSSKSFSDIEVKDYKRLYEKKLPRQLKTSVRCNENTEDSLKDNLEKLNSNRAGCSVQVGKEFSLKEKKNSDEVKRETIHSSLTITNTKDFKTPFTFSNPNKSSNSELKTNSPTSFSNKKTYRYEPYSRNFRHKLENSVSDVTENSFDDLTKEIQEFISEIMAVTNEPDEESVENSSKESTLLHEKKAAASDLNPRKSEFCKTEVTSEILKRARSHNVPRKTRSRTIACWRKPQKKKTVYSTRISNRKVKVSAEGERKELK